MTILGKRKPGREKKKTPAAGKPAPSTPIKSVPITEYDLREHFESDYATSREARTAHLAIIALLILVLLNTGGNYLKMRSIHDSMLYDIEISEENRRALGVGGASSWRAITSDTLARHEEVLLELQGCLCSTSKTCVLHSAADRAPAGTPVP